MKKLNNTILHKKSCPNKFNICSRLLAGQNTFPSASGDFARTFLWNVEHWLVVIQSNGFQLLFFQRQRQWKAIKSAGISEKEPPIDAIGLSLWRINSWRWPNDAIKHLLSASPFLLLMTYWLWHWLAGIKIENQLSVRRRVRLCVKRTTISVILRDWSTEKPGTIVALHVGLCLFIG